MAAAKQRYGVRLNRWLLMCVGGMLVSTGVRAVILLGNGDPSANTTPPEGTLTGSGWDTQTDAGPCATAIGSRHLLTAAHIGTTPGFALNFGGLIYPVVRIADAPGSDLRLLEVAGRLDPARIAPLYTQTNEVGHMVVLHGRGGPRGVPVTVDRPRGTELRGWQWTGFDGRLRWGTNVIEDVAVQTGANPGSFLLAWFDENAGDLEATVSIGDSGGGVFLRDGDAWKLAGVMNGVESEFRRTADGETFAAALFNRRGFYELDSEAGWLLDPTANLQPATYWQATRVSSYADWVTSEMAQPPTGSWPMLLSAATAEGPFTEHTAYAVDISQRQISALTTPAQRYFRIDGAGEIQSVKRSGGELQLQY